MQEAEPSEDVDTKVSPRLISYTNLQKRSLSLSYYILSEILFLGILCATFTVAGHTESWTPIWIAAPIWTLVSHGVVFGPQPFMDSSWDKWIFLVGMAACFPLDVLMFYYEPFGTVGTLSAIYAMWLFCCFILTTWTIYPALIGVESQTSFKLLKARLKFTASIMAPVLDTFSDFAMGLSLIRNGDNFGWVILALSPCDGGSMMKEVFFPNANLKQMLIGYAFNIVAETPIFIITVIKMYEVEESRNHGYISAGCFILSTLYKIVCVVRRAITQPDEWANLFGSKGAQYIPTNKIEIIAEAVVVSDSSSEVANNMESEC